MLGDSAKKKTIRFDDNFDSIRFDSKKMHHHLHHQMASLTLAVLILFVVSTFFLHINRMLNAGFLAPKKL